MDAAAPRSHHVSSPKPSTMFGYPHARRESSRARASHITSQEPSMFTSIRRSRPTRSTVLLAAAIVLAAAGGRSEEHTSELQSHVKLVCRLLLEKKKMASERASSWSYGSWRPTAARR